MIDIMTNLARGMDEQAIKGLFRGIGDKWKTLDQGASTLVVAGFDPGLDGRQRYLMPMHEGLS
jgi:hypothetical protein